MKEVGFGRLLWNGIRKRMLRNLATIFCFAFVTASILSANFLVGGAQNSVNVGMNRLGADMLVVPQQFATQTEAIFLTGKPSMFFFNSSVYENVSVMPGVAKASPQLFIATLNNASCCSLPVQLIGFNDTLDFTVGPWLAQQLGRPLSQDEILVGGLIIGEIGGHLLFYGHDFTIAGRLELTGMGIDTSIFIRSEDAFVMAYESAWKAVQKLELDSSQISAVLVKLDGSLSMDDVINNIESSMPEAKVLSHNYLARKVGDQLSGTTSVLLLTATAVTLVTIPLVAVVSSMIVNERKREIGLLRALGASKRFIFTMTLVEAMLLAGIGALVGALGTILIMVNFQGLIASSLRIPFLWPPLSAVMTQSLSIGLLAVAIGGLAALYPAVRSSGLDPYAAIRSGEA